MCCWRALGTFLLAGVVWVSNLRAEEDAKATTPAEIREAIQRSIPLLEQGMRRSAEERQCFTCHNQAMPVLALAEARRLGFAVDEDNFEKQLQHTAAHLDRGRKGYSEGRGQGGSVLTAGYALWTLAAGGRSADDTTAAVTHFLLHDESAGDHWSHPGQRPPSSGSDFTATYVALNGLKAFGTDEQRPEIDARAKNVRQWIFDEQPDETEDRVFRLMAMPYLEPRDQDLEVATKALIETQRDDGGWAQRADMESDAYATGSSLVALLTAGDIPTDHESVRRGVTYLLRTQLDDGSWHVTTRAEPFQTYFESGFPHGKDQFISMAASSWATWALLLTLPE